MKKFVKLLLCVLSIIMCTSFISGCGGDKFAGTWTAKMKMSNGLASYD